MGDVFRPAKVIRLKQKQFDDRREQLIKRMSLLANGLSAIGLTTMQLNTQSLIELYYNSYNPKTSAQQPMATVEELQMEKQ